MEVGRYLEKILGGLFFVFGMCWMDVDGMYISWQTGFMNLVVYDVFPYSEYI